MRKSIYVRVNDKTHEKLEEIAATLGVSISDVVRMCLNIVLSLEIEKLIQLMMSTKAKKESCNGPLQDDYNQRPLT